MSVLGIWTLEFVFPFKSPRRFCYTARGENYWSGGRESQGLKMNPEALPRFPYMGGVNMATWLETGVRTNS